MFGTRGNIGVQVWRNIDLPFFHYVLCSQSNALKYPTPPPPKKKLPFHKDAVKKVSGTVF